MKLIQLAIVFIFLSAGFAQAEVAVIVHPSNTSSLSNKDISRIFLGKLTKFKNGKKATAYYLGSGHSSRDEFNKKVLRKSESQLKAYWSKLIFTGKGNPPDALGDPADVLAKVSSDENAIAYIDKAAVTDKVRVIASF